MVEVDQNYHVVFKQLVETINGSRQKVISIANTELLTTYWKIGRTIVEQKEKAGWGKKVIGKLANDLKAKFPNMKGLSLRNLAYMESFAAAWPFFPFTQQAAAQLPMVDPKNESSILQSPIAKLQRNENQHFEQIHSILLQIPWTHHTIILDRVKMLAERIFYIQETIRNGWSTNMLKLNIETRLHERKGNAITTNFDIRLSEDQAELARLTLKNPYIFDFLDIEASLQGIQTPLGVAEYELMPKQLKAEMPTIEELEQELGRDIESMINTTDEKNDNVEDILKEVKDEIN